MVHSHVQAKECHPRCPIRLAKGTASREGLGPVKWSDIVETQEATLEDIVAVRVLAVHPPDNMSVTSKRIWRKHTR